MPHSSRERRLTRGEDDEGHGDVGLVFQSIVSETHEDLGGGSSIHPRSFTNF